MEPKIIKGHIYKCKENCDKAYTKGRVYECEYEVFDGNNYSKEDIYGCGFITNNDGNEGHAWPYHPKEHPWTKEKPEENRWTKYFEDMGEKPHGVIISPYEVGDRVRWYCDDDAKVHTSKITAINIEIDKTGKPVFLFFTTLKWHGRTTPASFGIKEVRLARK